MAKVIEHVSALRSNMIHQLEVLMTTAFGLVAALAWNAAIQALFARIFGTASSLAPMFAYAITVTVIAVVATYYVSLLASGNKKA